MKTAKIYRYLVILAVTLLLPAVILYGAGLFVPNDQPYGYIAPPAFSSFHFSSGNEVAFAPWFETSSFQGDLLAVPLSSTGAADLLNPNWHAKTQLDVQNWDTGRKIVTWNSAASPPAGISFRWPDLTRAQQVAAGSREIVDFIRGDRTNETPNGLAFRSRSGVLGDIIHSRPVYVGAPNRGYTFDNYAAFKTSQASRPARVYVGANDGMLHAFDAATGNETWAYIPSGVIGNLPRLTVDPYQHQYFVDGGLTSGDAYYGGAWHTVLAGGLGAGGKSLFILDVTNPGSIATESDAATGIHTEYSDSGLGFTYSRPSIVKLNNGDWAVIAGNGYSNTTTGQAALYIIKIQDGSLIKKIAVGTADPANPNGLSSPTAIDIDGDADVDYVYAGDIDGNLWRFDLTDASSTAWGASFSGSPLFTATDGATAQAITTAPEVAAHPDGGYLILFSTGRLLVQGDATASPVHSIYGIRDNGSALGDSPTLLSQTLTEKTHAASSSRVLLSTASAIDWSSHQGWKTDLPSGLRVITDPVLRDMRLQFTAVNPTIVTGENWLIELDYLTGGAPSKTILDVNNDQTLNVSDNVDHDGNGTVEDIPEDRAVGQYQSFGLSSRPMVAAVGANDVAVINHLNAINPANPAPPVDAGPGLAGGHFDVDTSNQTVDWNTSGYKTSAHTHQYDDKYNLTVVDYFGLAEPPQLEINQEISNPSQRFKIIIGNAQLSPGGVLEINGTNISVTAYQATPVADLPIYVLGTPGPGETQLTSLKMSFDVNAILNGDLIATETGCVKANAPGAHSEYRNGALTIQAIDADNHQIDTAVFNVQGNLVSGTGLAKQMGSLPNTDSGLLWESTLFWHWEGGFCYGQSGWQAAYDACMADPTTCRATGGAGGQGSGVGTVIGSGSGEGSGSDVGSGSSEGNGNEEGGGSGSGSGSGEGSGSGAGGDPSQQVISTTFQSGSDIQTGRQSWREIF